MLLLLRECTIPASQHFQGLGNTAGLLAQRCVCVNLRSANDQEAWERGHGNHDNVENDVMQTHRQTDRQTQKAQSNRRTCQPHCAYPAGKNTLKNQRACTGVQCLIHNYTYGHSLGSYGSMCGKRHLKPASVESQCQHISVIMCYSFHILYVCW